MNKILNTYLPGAIGRRYINDERRWMNRYRICLNIPHDDESNKFTIKNIFSIDQWKSFSTKNPKAKLVLGHLLVVSEKVILIAITYGLLKSFSIKQIRVPESFLDIWTQIADRKEMTAIASLTNHWVFNFLPLIIRGGSILNEAFNPKFNPVKSDAFENKIEAIFWGRIGLMLIGSTQSNVLERSVGVISLFVAINTWKTTFLSKEQVDILFSELTKNLPQSVKGKDYKYVSVYLPSFEAILWCEGNVLYDYFQHYEKSKWDNINFQLNLIKAVENFKKDQDREKLLSNPHLLLRDDKFIFKQQFLAEAFPCFTAYCRENPKLKKNGAAHENFLRSERPYLEMLKYLDVENASEDYKKVLPYIYARLFGLTYEGYMEIQNAYKANPHQAHEFPPYL